MKNVDYLFDQMMNITHEFEKPKASVHRLMAKSSHIQGTIHAAVLVKYSNRFEKVKPVNRILDTDSGVPESAKQQEADKNRLRVGVKTAARVLALQSAKSKKQKAATIAAATA